MRSSTRKLIALGPFLASLVCPASLSAQVETSKLVPVDGGIRDYFGSQVALAGDLAVIAAVEDDDSGLDSGSVYVIDVNTGAMVHKLLASDGDEDDLFGWDLAVSGNRVIVGARGHDAGGLFSGAAYLFDLNTGQELFKIEPPETQSLQLFGSSVDMEGNLAIVGAPGKTVNGALSAGAAYIYDLVSGQLVHTLFSNTPLSSDGFGRQVVLDGQTVVVLQGRIQEAVHVFDLTTGLQTKVFGPSTAGNVSGWGDSIALEGNTLLVGNADGPSVGDNRGEVFLFDMGLEQEVAKLLSPSPFSFKYFGISLALENGVALIGEYGGGITNTDTGKVHVWDTQLVEQVAELEASDGHIWDGFGSAVSLDQGRMLIGASLDDENGEYSGSAYYYDFIPDVPGFAYCDTGGCPCGNDGSLTGCVNGSGVGALLEGTGSTSLATDNLVLTTTGLPPGQFALTVMGTLSFQFPAGNGLRCVAGALYRYTPVLNSGATGRIEVGPGLVQQSCTQFPAGGCITAASTWNFQTWYRDPSGPCGQPFNFSNGYFVTFTP